MEVGELSVRQLGKTALAVSVQAPSARSVVAVPVPLREAVCGVPEALSAKLKVPLRLPAAVGVKVTETLHWALAARLDGEKRAQLAGALPGLKERAKTLIELIDGAGFLFAARPLAMDAKAEDVLARGGRRHIAALLPRLEAVADWSAATTEAAVRDYAAARGVKLGVVAQPLRAAATGRTTSPGIFDVLAVLGRDEALARLRDQAAAG